MASLEAQSDNLSMATIETSLSSIEAESQRSDLLVAGLHQDDGKAEADDTLTAGLHLDDGKAEADGDANADADESEDEDTVYKMLPLKVLVPKLLAVASVAQAGSTSLPELRAQHRSVFAEFRADLRQEGQEYITEPPLKVLDIEVMDLKDPLSRQCPCCIQDPTTTFQVVADVGITKEGFVKALEDWLYDGEATVRGVSPFPGCWKLVDWNYMEDGEEKGAFYQWREPKIWLTVDRVLLSTENEQQ